MEGANIVKPDVQAIKKPDLRFPIHPLLASRWSPRAYDSRPVPAESLQRIFEAVRWSPSSSNLQPWNFLVGFKGDPVYEGIYSTLAEFNRLWANSAPVLAVCIGTTQHPKGGLNTGFSYDLGAAMAMLSVQAIAEGASVHQMGGFDKKQAAEKFQIPEGYEVVTAFTIGYPGDPELLHPNLKKLEYAPRTRKEVASFVFTGEFGHKASFLT